MKKRIFYFIIIIFLTNCSNFNFSEWGKKFRRKTEIKYYDNGCKKYSISYFNNKFDGPMIRWNENCNIISEANYENGMLHGYWKEYYPNGQIMRSIEYFYNQKNGLDIKYHDNGNIKSESKYEYDNLVSDVTWDKNGKILN